MVESTIKEVTPDIIINAAAYTAVDQAEKDAEPAYAVNRDGAGYLAKACRESNIPLIHISTDYVFDGTKTKPYIRNRPGFTHRYLRQKQSPRRSGCSTNPPKTHHYSNFLAV